MISFRQIVITRIKAAEGEKEIEEVIDSSIQSLKIKNVNGHIIQRFIMSMESSLLLARTEQVSEKGIHNMNFAITLFRGLQKYN